MRARLPQPIAFIFSALLLASLGLTGCKDQIDDSGLAHEARRAEAGRAAVATYATIAYAGYQDALTAAQALDAKARAFVAAPSAAGLEELKAAWKASRVPYSPTEAFRFYSGPIDADSTGPESRINAWPVDEQLIDYVVGAPTAGVVNNPALHPTITKALIERLNDGDANVTCGYHAIEFLLWGQDTSATGPGQRPYTDYTTAPNAPRRGQYLTACTGLLVDHLGTLVAAWAPTTAGNYRARFAAMPTDQALQKLMIGIGTLSSGELAEQRMQVALDNRDQEEEHDCFSDYTDQDLKGNEQGIRNVLLGTYRRPDGTTVGDGQGLIAAVRAADAAKADALAATSESAAAKVNAIQAPFDQEIIRPDGRDRVQAAVLALASTGSASQATALVGAASALGFSLVF